MPSVLRRTLSYSLGKRGCLFFHFLKNFIDLSDLSTQCWAPSHDPDIRSHVLFHNSAGQVPLEERIFLESSS